MVTFLYKSFFLCFTLVDDTFDWVTADIVRTDCSCSVESIRVSINERITWKLFLSLEQNTSLSLVEEREREKKDRSRGDTCRCHRKNWMNGQVAVCCFIKELVAFRTRIFLFIYCFFFRSIHLVWPYYVFDALPIFFRSFIFLLNFIFKTKFHISIRIYPSRQKQQILYFRYRNVINCVFFQVMFLLYVDSITNHQRRPLLYLFR